MRKAALNRAAHGCACATCRPALNRAEASPAAEPDLVDRTGLDDSADWEEQTGPILDAVMAAAGRAKSFEEFSAAITKLYGALPTGRLQARLALASTKARGPGQVQDDV